MWQELGIGEEGGCSGFFSVAMLTTIIKKQSGEEMVYFSLQVTAHHQWKRRQELEAGTWKRELQQRS